MELLLSHKEGILYGLLGFIIFGWLLAKIPGILIAWCIAKVDAAYAKGDTADDRFLTAFLRFSMAFFVWVEEKYGADWASKLELKIKTYASVIPIGPFQIQVSANTTKIMEFVKKMYDLGKQAAAKEIEQHEEPPTP